MGTWNTKINGNDTFLDIYENYFYLYNEGGDPQAVSNKIQQNYTDMFEDYDEKHDSLFGLALAQWETKSLDPVIFKQVREIIETGKDIERWKELGADDKTLKKRQAALEKFLVQLSTERKNPKRRVRPKFESGFNEFIHLIAPDGKKTFKVFEHFINGVYVDTGSVLSWEMGGGSIMYFAGQGKFVSAKWRDSQTLEIMHDKDIVFIKKDETFGFDGDLGIVVYIPTNLRPV